MYLILVKNIRGTKLRKEIKDSPIFRKFSTPPEVVIQGNLKGNYHKVVIVGIGFFAIFARLCAFKNMANEIIQNNYGDENIRTLEGVEHIRLRPGMYIGTLGNGDDPADGIYVLLKDCLLYTSPSPRD